MHLEEREHNNVYQNLQQDIDYLEATSEEAALCEQYENLDLSEEEQNVIPKMDSQHPCPKCSLHISSLPYGDAMLFFPTGTSGGFEISTEKSEVS